MGRSESVAIAAVIGSIGIFIAAAGAFELLSDRNLPPGWTRHQPPWTVPALVVGVFLMALAAAILLVSALRHRARDERS